MNHLTVAVLEQIKLLSAVELRELVEALPNLESGDADHQLALDQVYQALVWRYEGAVDDAARVRSNL